MFGVELIVDAERRLLSAPFLPWAKLRIQLGFPLITIWRKPKALFVFRLSCDRCQSLKFSSELHQPHVQISAVSGAPHKATHKPRSFVLRSAHHKLPNRILKGATFCPRNTIALLNYLAFTVLSTAHSWDRETGLDIAQYRC